METPASPVGPDYSFESKPCLSAGLSEGVGAFAVQVPIPAVLILLLVIAYFSIIGRPRFIKLDGLLDARGEVWIDFYVFLNGCRAATNGLLQASKQYAIDSAQYRVSCGEGVPEGQHTVLMVLSLLALTMHLVDCFGIKMVAI